ncbi:FkbM family methyltransferase [Pseudomonas sp. ZM23]|uniref:FkbM family methyltransferase n=1 Tax=Pseudomonas triclosanedens TaxID=2961893 RepID=A0ABY6ZWR4_9PSED|nr:FkbM family methyltransferase [Pseudomonas triclosanedens]MCP8467850.1 FkbM family methyltransferase [Pseudomonas triclosanedens]MCP8469951.1 FkbM family methyltransferase [Pseudomonas triclosanedens]WAI49283.1 FkbM family methyltransferase [Pseudomonas triclosanedens]
MSKLPFNLSHALAPNPAIADVSTSIDPAVASFRTEDGTRSMKTLLNKWLSRQDIQHTDRILNALSARQQLTNDFFGGWNPEDIEHLQRYRYDGPVNASSGEILDWLGIRTDIRLHAWLPAPTSGPLVIGDLPIPDDRVHAETIEYIALICSLERAHQQGRNSFAVMELGASYGPWAIASGLLALRNGFDYVSLTAVEANEASVPMITEHARRNGLLDVSNVELNAIHGAVHVRDETVYFPKVDTNHDNGAQLTLTPTALDYRGLTVQYNKVPGISLAKLCERTPRIDFLHMDLQGAEEALLQDESFLQHLNDHVGTLFIATQSRLIEGLALKKLSALGWTLYRERPTTYQQNDRTADVNGWTLRDGGQIWFNHHPIPA